MYQSKLRGQATNSIGPVTRGSGLRLSAARLRERATWWALAGQVILDEVG